MRWLIDTIDDPVKHTNILRDHTGSYRITVHNRTIVCGIETYDKAKRIHRWMRQGGPSDDPSAPKRNKG